MNDSIKNIHFIGVSGIGVSAVAEISVKSGFKVTGSADMKNELTKKLKQIGMEFYQGHRKENIDDPDIVVMSAAVPDDNPEIIEAKKRGIPIYLYSEYLGLLMNNKLGIAIAGTHGKTTTTAITGLILYNAGLDPSVVCGGVMKNFSSNTLSGSGKYFVSEACEYNRSFLDLNKYYSIVTNIEPDHLDYYKNIDDIKSAFFDFLNKIKAGGFSVVNGDDKNVMSIISQINNKSIYTVGLNEDNDYKIFNIKESRGIFSFDIENENKILLKLKLKIAGLFNCINSSLAAVLSLRLGVENKIIEKTVNQFNGTERRLELLGVIDKNYIYSDYAHHPTEILQTINALRNKYPSKKIMVIFQPHQYSRTFYLFDDFIKSLKEADNLIITDIYRQRDSSEYIEKVNSYNIFEKLESYMNKRITYIKDKNDIINFLNKKRFDNMVIVFMGAGDIDDVVREYVKGKEKQ